MYSCNSCRFSSSDERSGSDEESSLLSKKKKSEKMFFVFLSPLCILATSARPFWAHCYPLPGLPSPFGLVRPDRGYRSNSKWGGGEGGGEEGRRWKFRIGASGRFHFSPSRFQKKNIHSFVHCPPNILSFPLSNTFTITQNFSLYPSSALQHIIYS